MHNSVKRAIARFYFDNRDYLDQVRVADMGALNINGSAREVIPHCTGFDIVDGPGVDVRIEPGQIPEAHRGVYGAVLSISSFTFCPEPALYKRQLVDLLAPGGLLLLTCCSVHCKARHSTSSNGFGFADSFRVALPALAQFFASDFDLLEVSEQHYEHPDYVLVARLKPGQRSAAAVQAAEVLA